MVETDLILDGSHAPDFDEISGYIGEAGQKLWQGINSFLQERYKALPNIAYSKCSAKPGWNVKYQKSGKSLCTLYPERDGFIALVVITLDLLPVIEELSDQFETEVMDTVRSARPFNGTKWLMIQVRKSEVLDNVKQLLLLKKRVK